jgi:Ribonuclease HI
MWKGYFDGACDNNGSKEMQIGAVLIHDNNEVEKISRRVGIGTSNVAEYLALIALLERCNERGLIDDRDRGMFWIYGDSKLVIQQVRLRWKVRADHLRPYRDRVLELNENIRARFAWIPREQNTLADALSKRLTTVQE